MPKSLILDFFDMSKTSDVLPGVYGYKNLKVVVEKRDFEIKIMTEVEYRQLYPILATSRVASGMQNDPIAGVVVI